MPPFVTLTNVKAEIHNSPFTESINWQINQGEIWSVTGPNGSGKSLLADIICGRFLIIRGSIGYHFFNFESDKPGNKIKTIRFDSVFSLADYRNSYYQLRFNNPDDDVAPFVSSLFTQSWKGNCELAGILKLLDIEKLADRRLVELSSGELRRFLIARILFDEPAMLIFDNPFIGLDVESRQNLDEIFPHIAASGIQMLFLVPEGSKMPGCTTHVLEMKNCELTSANTVGAFLNQQTANNQTTHVSVDWCRLPLLPDISYDIAVKMEKITIAYGGRNVCRNLDWTVKKGEKWALLGPNGSGKSTLLSYIYADNPRSYAEGLTLFGSRRGSGESIWEIKQRIGFTSSEMHLYYRKKTSCLEVVESGLFDSVGLYRTTHGEERQIAAYIMECLLIGSIKNRIFSEVSSGEQKMVLFARALVKNPELLILDEPYNQLDNLNKTLCEGFLNAFCAQAGKTLIFVTHWKDEIPACADKYLNL